VIIRLFPTPTQQEILEDKSRIKVVDAGRRYGKTALAMMAMISYACRKPRSRVIFAAPSYNLSKQVYKDMLEDPGFCLLVHSKAEQPTPWIKLVNGSAIRFFSCDKADRNRGHKADLLIVDEARDVRHDDYRRVLSPMVADTRGDTIILSTPRGREHWFWQLYEQGQKQNDLGVKSFYRPTSLGYCFQGPDGESELRRQKELVDELTWQQEFLGNPLANRTAAFPEKHIAQCLGGELAGCSPAHRHIVSWDLGKAYDPSGVIVLRDDGLVCRTYELEIGLDYKLQLQRIKEIVRAYKAMLVVDQTGTVGDSTIDFIRGEISDVRPIFFTNRTKEGMVQNLRLALERQRLLIPEAHERLLKQARLYEAFPKEFHVEYKCPDQVHDDLIVALILGWHALEQGWLPDSHGLDISYSQY
jgi:hypothetical protein